MFDFRSSFAFWRAVIPLIVLGSAPTAQSALAAAPPQAEQDFGLLWPTLAYFGLTETWIVSTEYLVPNGSTSEGAIVPAPLSSLPDIVPWAAVLLISFLPTSSVVTVISHRTTFRRERPSVSLWMRLVFGSISWRESQKPAKSKKIDESAMIGVCSFLKLGGMGKAYLHPLFQGGARYAMSIEPQQARMTPYHWLSSFTRTKEATSPCHSQAIHQNGQ
ncbi:hypothetical protein N7468_005157 [Penicillium chermesinum]|uniref:Uncharacterized protein n=1 Tax=Penicillium chermesinum TaxID=63820 RepID=A0A9W9NYM9_9EURO|nr:uncharacterized protein N7468_005157 [Penicillium chermesinum]KAJ5232201.1 hypothetical protein N7468_005157 [Penicillium chermesinum]